MSTIYAPSKPSPSTNINALFVGLALAGAVCATLPFLNSISGFINPPTYPVAPPVQEILPPRIEDPVEPPPVQNDVAKEIEFQPPDIDIIFKLLNNGLNPSDNGTGIGVNWTTVQGISTEIFLPDELDKAPRVLVAVAPQYPYSQRGNKGEVIVEFILGADGKPRRPIIKKSSHRDFERPAIEAIMRSKWDPGMKNAKAVDSLVRLPIYFKK